jgi:hypothetical protein
MARSRHLIVSRALVLRAAVLAAVGLGAAAGCATSPSAGAGAPRKNLTATDFYPLAMGWKWAYDVEKVGQKVPILAVYSVLERTPDTATVQAGEDRLTYAITADGIAQKEGEVVGDYVIKNPVTVGAEWRVAGGTAKVVALGRELSVAAGHFTDCAVVEVTRADPVRIARTTFSPDVGPVALEFQVQEQARFVTETRATLRSVTRPGEDLFH